MVGKLPFLPDCTLFICAQYNRKVDDEKAEIGVNFELYQSEYILTVSDNGIGLSSEVDWNTAESLGLKLVNLWVTHQLQGSLKVDTHGGTTVTIRFAALK